MNKELLQQTLDALLRVSPSSGVAWNKHQDAIRALHEALAQPVNKPVATSAGFTTWSQESLVRFAQDARDRLLEQHDSIERLQGDIKDAMKAYRELLRREVH